MAIVADKIRSSQVAVSLASGAERAFVLVLAEVFRMVEVTCEAGIWIETSVKCCRLRVCAPVCLIRCNIISAKANTVRFASFAFTRCPSRRHQVCAYWANFTSVLFSKFLTGNALAYIDFDLLLLLYDVDAVDLRLKINDKLQFKTITWISYDGQTRELQNSIDCENVILEKRGLFTRLSTQDNH